MRARDQDGGDLAIRRAQWERFAEWEKREEAARVRSVLRDLEWLEEAISLTVQLDPEWGSLPRVREKAMRLARLRGALSVLGPRAA